MRGTPALVLDGADDEDGLALVAGAFPAAVNALSAERSLIVALEGDVSSLLFFVLFVCWFGGSAAPDFATYLDAAETAGYGHR